MFFLPGVTGTLAGKPDLAALKDDIWGERHEVTLTEGGGMHDFISEGRVARGAQGEGASFSARKRSRRVMQT